jgi:hypothetical protein
LPPSYASALPEAGPQPVEQPGDLRRNCPRRPAGLLDDFPLLESARFHEKELLILLLELGNLLSQELYALVIGDPRGDIQRVSADCTSDQFFGATLGRRLGRNPLVPFLQEVDGAIADHGLEKGDELRNRPATELNEAPGIKGGERVREDVVRIRLRKPEGTEGPATYFLEWSQERSPGIWVPASTAVDQLEEIRADRALRYPLA